MDFQAKGRPPLDKKSSRGHQTLLYNCSEGNVEGNKSKGLYMLFKNYNILAHPNNLTINLSLFNKLKNQVADCISKGKAT